MLQGGEGGSFEFGVDANLDPELALALRVSLEEERARHAQQGGALPRSCVVDSARMRGLGEDAHIMALVAGTGSLSPRAAGKCASPPV